MPGRCRALICTLVAPLLLAFLLRVDGLGAQSLWYDEGFSVDLASRGWRQIVSGELNLPPLYNLLLGGWERLAGQSEFAVRFLSVFWGLLVVALGGVLGAQLLGRRVGAFAALFLAVSPIEVWYAQEARMYAALAALSLCSTVCLVRLMRGDRRASLWALYAISSLAALYTHYYAALILVAQAAWVLLTLPAGRDWRFCRSWLGAQVLVGAALLPWLGVFWRQWRAANTTYWPGLLRWQDMAARTALGFAGEDLMVSHTPALILALLAGGLAVLGFAAGLRRARSRWGVLLLAVYIVVPFTALYLLVHARPKYSPRYLLPIVPGLLILAANGVVSVWPRRVRRWWDVGRAGLALATGGILVMGPIYVATNPLRDHSFGRDDMRGAAAFLSREVGPDEAVILLSGHAEPVFAYYYRAPYGNCYPLPRGLPPSPSVDDAVTLDVLPDLSRAIQGRSGAWILLWQDEVVDPNRVVLTAFDLMTTRVPVMEQLRGLKLRHYVFPVGTSLHRGLFGRIPLNVPIGEQTVMLVSCDLPIQPVPSGGVATILLHWQVLQRTKRDYRLSLQIVDDEGQELGGYGGRLAAWMLPTYQWQPGRLIMARHDITLPPGLPPGEYNLQARIFAVGEETAQLVPLGRFQVARAPRPAAPAELRIPYPLSVQLGELEVMGYDISPTQVTPGQVVYLSLFLRANATPAQRYRVAVQLGDRPWASRPLPAAVVEMLPGDVYRVQYGLPLPRDAQGGPQRVAIALEGEDGRSLAPPIALAEIAVQGGERLFEVPAHVQTPVRFDLGGQVNLLGLDLDRDVIRPGETLHLTLYWQAAQAMETSYKVFVHLLDGQEEIWGQVDAIPQDWQHPTTGWLPGEVVVDTYDVTVRNDAPEGQYMIEIGLYDAATMVRLAVRDQAGNRQYADRILLHPVQLLAAGRSQ